MAHNEALPPLRAEDYLDRPYQLRQDLEMLGALEFEAHASGLYPASALSPQMGQQTGMRYDWFRDNAHVGAALYASGNKQQGLNVARAMVTVLQDNMPGLNEVVRDKSSAFRLPVRVDGDTLERDAENRVQHDSTGYMLWLPSNLMASHALRPTAGGLEAMAQTVRYLRSLEYWHDADAGAWEEGERIHASSIAVVMAGIRDAQCMFERLNYETAIDFTELLEYGRYGYQQIFAQDVTSMPPGNVLPDAPLPLRETPLSMDTQTSQFLGNFDINKRRYDAALLFGVAMNVFESDEARQIVADVKARLLRPRGIARYEGDTYWAPGFKELMKPQERTTSAPGRLEMREQVAAGVAYTGTEAQWTLFDPLLAVDSAKQYLLSGSGSAFEEHLMFLNRHLSQLEPQSDGTYKWPEARYYEFAPNRARQKYSLNPNDHTPLLWTQANSLYALKYFAMIATQRKMATE